MLKGEVEEIDLQAEKEKLLKDFSSDVDFEVSDDSNYKFEFPVDQYPEKIVSLNFDKEKIVEGVLKGIKGQYLIFEHGVINIRKFSSYQVRFSLPLKREPQLPLVYSSSYISSSSSSSTALSIALSTALSCSPTSSSALFFTSVTSSTRSLNPSSSSTPICSSILSSSSACMFLLYQSQDHHNQLLFLYLFLADL